jgi:hypothetical protein
MRNLLLVAGLASLPLLSIAQTTETPHFYVGVGAFLASSEPFQDYYTTRVGPALTAGRQFTPRLALQLSGAYTWRNYGSSTVTSFAGSVPTGTYDYKFHDKALTFPLLLRATLTNPTKRLRVDALGGPVLRINLSRFESSETYLGQTSFYRSERYSTSDFLVALGPALRYTVTPQVELVFDALVSIGVDGYYRNFNGRLSSNLLAGVHYSFGG